jgi:hypothetical protein
MSQQISHSQVEKQPRYRPKKQPRRFVEKKPRFINVSEKEIVPQIQAPENKECLNAPSGVKRKEKRLAKEISHGKRIPKEPKNSQINSKNNSVSRKRKIKRDKRRRKMEKVAYNFN